MKKSNSQYLFEAGASKKRQIDAKAKNPFVEKSKAPPFKIKNKNLSAFG